MAQHPETLEDHQPQAAAWRVPAWLLSTAVHLALLILLALVVRSAPRSLPDEADRQVSVALASRNAEQRAEYFDEQDAQTDTESTSDSSASGGSALAAALPQPEAAAPLAQLPLPRLPTGGDVLVAAPQLNPARRAPILPGENNDEAIMAAEAARRKANAPHGPPTRLGIFGSPAAAGYDFVFVIDRSKSMGEEGLGALSAAEKELTAALAELQPHHRFQVIAYHQQPTYVGARSLLPATDENKRAMQTFFQELLAHGGTQHATALLAALRLDPDVVFLLTDGGDPYLTANEIDYISRRARGKSTIHCIQFGFGSLRDDNDFMRRLASRNGGSYGYVDMSARRSER